MTAPIHSASRSADIARKHREYLWPAVGTLYQQPLVADRAHMQYLWDLEGRKYLDFFGGILTTSLGHSEPRITAAMGSPMSGVLRAMLIVTVVAQ